jgi:site-specific DNA-methyltransferase (adenine-specific)
VEVVEEFLHLLTPSDALVLDPFIGSGSTAVACKKLGRQYIGYDINPEYCEYARQRVSDTPHATPSLFEGM